jgi:hypothetical protein
MLPRPTRPLETMGLTECPARYRSTIKAAQTTTGSGSSKMPKRS